MRRTGTFPCNKTINPTVLCLIKPRIMSAVPTPTAAPSSPRGARHRYRGRRGASYNTSPTDANPSTSSRPSAASDASLSLQQATISAPNQQESPDVTITSNVGGNYPRGRTGRGGRRGASGMQAVNRGGRIFGGHLTRGGASYPSTGSLHADAPEFRPGQSVQQRQYVFCSTG